MSHKRIQRIISIYIVTGFIFIGGIISLYAFCSDNKPKFVEAASYKALTNEVKLTLFGFSTVPELQKVQIIVTPAPTITPTTPTMPTPTPTATPKPKKLASNGKEYKYYEVYDKYYGSDKWHSLSKKLQEYTYELCIEYKIEKYYTLLLCQMYHESKYNPKAVSASNDYGLAQINICNHRSLRKKLGITNFLDPRQSILCNVYMMSGYLKEVGAEKALLWYNSGNPNTTIKRSWGYKSKIITLWNDCIRIKKK